ncbi:MAG: transcriptional regulator GcvA [Pseudomonadota bacterium]
MVATRRLPNFSALRAFEAAARHQNFSRAADELHLTHGAISHQVRALEQDLGLLLFVRNGRHVTVTPEGQRFAQTLGRAFADIADGADALRPAAHRSRLTVSSLPSFAARWLAPRLGQFIEAHPGTEISLHSSSELQDLAREGIDVGIRFGRGHYPGLVSERLMGDNYYPVVSPHYRGGRLPATVKEMAEATLLRSDEPWLPWFQAAGLELAEPRGGVLLQDQSLLIRSAVDGNGVALVRHVMALQEIADGTLVRLFDVAAASRCEYYFVCPPEALARPPVQAFRAWLLGAIARFNEEQAARSR